MSGGEDFGGVCRTCSRTAARISSRIALPISSTNVQYRYRNPISARFYGISAAWLDSDAGRRRLLDCNFSPFGLGRWRKGARLLGKYYEPAKFQSEAPTNGDTMNLHPAPAPRQPMVGAVDVLLLDLVT